MLDRTKPYELRKIQKASPCKGDAFDVSYIYSFRTERTDRYQSLRYIVRVEQFEGVSSYLLVNRKGCEDIEAKTQRIKDLFLSKFEFEL